MRPARGGLWDCRRRGRWGWRWGRRMPAGLRGAEGARAVMGRAPPDSAVAFSLQSSQSPLSQRCQFWRPAALHACRARAAMTGALVGAQASPPPASHLLCMGLPAPCPACAFRLAAVWHIPLPASVPAPLAQTPPAPPAPIPLQVGLSAIPQRFVEGLTDGRELAALAAQLAAAAFPEREPGDPSGSGEAADV